MKDTFRQVIVIVGTLAVIAVNGLASSVGINGKLTGQISDQFHVLFVPAGLTFAIWGLIYLALLAFTVYQALPSQRENPRLRRIGLLYVLTCAANIAWLFLWHYGYFEWTLVAMGVLLLTLIVLYLILGTGRRRASKAQSWLVRVPFSLYLGWITVATIANVTAVLETVKWNQWGLSDVAWAVIMLIVAAIITTIVSLRRGDVAYVLVVAWAFAGIALKQNATIVVAAVASAMALVVLLTLLVGAPLARERMRSQAPAPAADMEVRDRW
jgi:benzodiazapine receptor